MRAQHRCLTESSLIFRGFKNLWRRMEKDRIDKYRLYMHLSIQTLIGYMHLLP